MFTGKEQEVVVRSVDSRQHLDRLRCCACLSVLPLLSHKHCNNTVQCTINLYGAEVQKVSNALYHRS